MTQQRISKFLSTAGMCSRRQAEELIAAGRIKLNHQIVTTPATFVTDEDTVTLDNRTVRLNFNRKLWGFYKPVGCITSNHDPEGRKTIYDYLPPNFKNIKYVGRLDYSSEGLLLLTNDGNLSQELQLPKNKIPRKYKVRIYGSINPNIVEILAKGIVIEGIRYQGIQVEIQPTDGKNTWLKMTLLEGKNREIRNIMSHFGYQINRLVRTDYGPFSLDTMKPGQFKELPINTIDTYLRTT